MVKQCRCRMQSRQPDQGISEPRMGFSDELTGRVRGRHQGGDEPRPATKRGCPSSQAPRIAVTGVTTSRTKRPAWTTRLEICIHTAMGGSSGVLS